MSRLRNRTSRVFLAGFALLLVGSAAAFAQHNATLAQLFTAPVVAVATATKPAIQEAARARPLVKVILAAAIERNSKRISLEEAGPVAPGEVVSFTMSSLNEGSAPARQYRSVGQIPRGATFVAGSAKGDRNSQVSYSIDGGQQFSPRPMIDEKQADGTLKKVPAPVSMYTQVRFEWPDPLPVGGELVASYQVRIK